MRLVDPVTGTVVHCEGALADLYRARGWSEPDQASVAPEKPKRTRKKS